MKQIVYGGSGSGKSYRSLNIASEYEGTVFYYLGITGASFSLYYGELLDRLFSGGVYQVIDDNECSPVPGNKYFLPREWAVSSGIKDKNEYGNMACRNFREAYTKLAAFNSFCPPTLPDYIRKKPGNTLLVIDDNAWAEGIDCKLSTLKRLERCSCDVIINIIYPEELGIYSKELLSAWDIYMADGNYGFLPVGADRFFMPYKAGA